MPNHSPTQNLKWSTERRLQFIEFRLFWEGRINRADLKSRFGISTPQTATDFKQYQTLAPGNMVYDTRRKCYSISSDFTPLFQTPNAHDYLARLRLLGLGLHDREESWLGIVPAFDMARPPTRRVEADKLRSVLQAIHSAQALHIQYQSMSRPEPVWRWISPHALGFDGFRWHARAWCHLRQRFQDFVFARMLTLGEHKNTNQNNQQRDKAWEEHVMLRIGPHPELNPAARKAIELDYNMENGEVGIRTRLALSYYLERQLGLDAEATALSPERQQIVLLNPEELQSARNTVENQAAKRHPQ